MEGCYAYQHQAGLLMAVYHCLRPSSTVGGGMRCYHADSSEGIDSRTSVDLYISQSIDFYLHFYTFYIHSLFNIFRSFPWNKMQIGIKKSLGF